MPRHGLALPHRRRLKPVVVALGLLHVLHSVEGRRTLLLLDVIHQCQVHEHILIFGLNAACSFRTHLHHGRRHVDRSRVQVTLDADVDRTERARSANAGRAVQKNGRLGLGQLLEPFDFLEKQQCVSRAHRDAVVRPFEVMRVVDRSTVRLILLAQEQRGDNETVVRFGFLVDDLVRIQIERFLRFRRPVGIAFVHAGLAKVGRHDDDGDVLLPDHTPEVLLRRLQRT